MTADLLRPNPNTCSASWKQSSQENYTDNGRGGRTDTASHSWKLTCISASTSSLILEIPSRTLLLMFVETGLTVFHTVLELTVEYRLASSLILLSWLLNTEITGYTPPPVTCTHYPSFPLSWRLKAAFMFPIRFFDELSLEEMSSSSGPQSYVSLKHPPCFQQVLEQIHSPGFYSSEPSDDNVRKSNKRTLTLHLPTVAQGRHRAIWGGIHPEL